MLEHKYKMSIHLVLISIIRFILEYLELIMKPLLLLVTLFKNLKVFGWWFGFLFYFKNTNLRCNSFWGRMHINIVRC